MDLLVTREKVQLDTMYGHGGFFKTAGVGQRLLAAAITTPVSVGEIAGEGGAWGMALLAQFLHRSDDRTLSDYLAQTIFAGAAVATVAPDTGDVAGFDAFMTRYRRGLSIERAAVEALA
jgi:sugar (pentulose or hexulose) kinase